MKMTITRTKWMADHQLNSGDFEKEPGFVLKPIYL